MDFQKEDRLPLGLMARLARKPVARSPSTPVPVEGYVVGLALLTEVLCRVGVYSCEQAPFLLQSNQVVSRLTEPIDISLPERVSHGCLSKDAQMEALLTLSVDVASHLPSVSTEMDSDFCTQGNSPELGLDRYFTTKTYLY
jgi:hypothetical protein